MEGVEQDVLLKHHPPDRLALDVRTETPLTSDYKLLILTQPSLTFKVVSRVVKAGWKPNPGR